jgi:hypothetical protein
MRQALRATAFGILRLWDAACWLWLEFLHVEHKNRNGTAFVAQKRPIAFLFNRADKSKWQKLKTTPYNITP